MTLAENGRYKKLTVDHIHDVEQDLIFWTVPHGRTMRLLLKDETYLVKTEKIDLFRRLMNLPSVGLPYLTKSNKQETQDA